MAFNLLRNTRAFFTTNVNSSGTVASTGFLDTNTFEIQVQDGLGFSQNTSTETVTLDEAGATPVRGQRSFNTALEPVDFNFTSYIRPNGAGTNVTAEELVLWGAFTSANGTAGITSGPTATVVDFESSDTHQLQTFGMIFLVDSVMFVIDNCALDSATIDFGLDQIASIAWAGKGTTLRRIEDAAADAGAFTSGLTGSFLPKVTTAPYLTNKLSTASISSGLSGGTTYTIALTGGSITFSNNLSYLTPANLGVVNTPISYYTGTRAISGSFNAYLRTGGTNDTSDLMQALLSNTSDVDPLYRASVNIGGASAATRLDIVLPAVMPAIPTVSTDQVVSTTINFTAQGNDATDFDVTTANEATITYVA